MNDSLSQLWYLPRSAVLGLIRLYQHTLSPDHSPWRKHVFPAGYCKFTPSCSQYGYEAIKNHGIIRGVLKSVWRVLRCNPWSRGGVDRP